MSGISAELIAIVAVGVTLAAIFAPMLQALRREVRDLNNDHSGLARELSELRGEFRGRLGAPDSPGPQPDNPTP